jgi:hypothetical protein
VKKFKIDFLSEAFFLDSHGELSTAAVVVWHQIHQAQSAQSALGLVDLVSNHDMQPIIAVSPFLHCVLYDLIFKLSFSDVPDSTWNAGTILIWNRNTCTLFGCIFKCEIR